MPKFRESLSLLLHALLEIRDAPDKCAGESRLIEVSTEHGFAQVGGALGEHAHLARTGFHLGLEVFKVGIDHFIDGATKSRLILRRHALTIDVLARGVRLI